MSALRWDRHQTVTTRPIAGLLRPPIAFIGALDVVIRQPTYSDRMLTPQPKVDHTVHHSWVGVPVNR
jgi:hypothetical protein